MSENNLTHFDAAGNAVMVDVSGKPVTAREATARGILTMNAEAFAAVQSGTVKKGDVLMVLEAMKMENEIMCPRDGVVASVNTSKGASVECGTLLCVLQ